jgi:hypothetical protein
MNLDLTDEETAVLLAELDLRIRTLTAILAKIRLEPAREPLPRPKVYAPPRAVLSRRRRG